MSSPQTRKLTIVAQDPSITHNNRILTCQVPVPLEELQAGPTGHRLRVDDVDYEDGSPYTGVPYPDYDGGDPFETPDDATILGHPRFHAQNVYAIAMRSLTRFETALGRRISWQVGSHQLRVLPHAFGELEAYYYRPDEGMFFGYVPRDPPDQSFFSCLSHDVVVHETTHALLDGLCEYYLYPSLLDQDAFHEAFADITALLSVFSLEGIVSVGLDLGDAANSTCPRNLISRDRLLKRELIASFLMGFAEEYGQEFYDRPWTLRRSARLPQSGDPHYGSGNNDAYERGEVLVAALVHAFLNIWRKRLSGLGEIRPGCLDRRRVAEEGAEAANHMLTIAVRALDYCPATDLEFPDYLSAVLTADYELYPDDSKYGYRRELREAFASYGIRPASGGQPGEPGVWQRPGFQPPLTYENVHLEALQRDPDEIFRFIWDNQVNLNIHPQASTRVLSVLPCRRRGPDGFPLCETVAQYVQELSMTAGEMANAWNLNLPAGMPQDLDLVVCGGGSLIFDEFGQLKYHVHKRVHNAARQERVLAYLWDTGYFEDGEEDPDAAAVARQAKRARARKRSRRFASVKKRKSTTRRR